MTTVQDIYRFIDQVAPFVIQESWDNAGMLVGHWKRPVQKILVTLDITPEVVYEAEKVGADLIVAHHPILFHPAKQVTDGGMDLVGQRVLALAERGKIALSSAGDRSCMLACEIGPELYSVPLDSHILSEICQPVFQKVREVIVRAVRDSEIPISAIQDVVLVGGSSQLGVFVDYLEELFSRRPTLAEHPEHTVALGVGMYAGIKQRDEDLREIVMTDVCPFSLGVASYNDLQDLNPHMATLIQRSSILPARRTERFYTLSPNQRRIRLEIYQGENYYASENLRLGELTVSVPPDEPGKQFASVTFAYDINGILEVTAQSSGGDIRRTVILNPQLNWSEEEIRQALERLNALPDPARSEEEDLWLLSRAERLFAELSDSRRAEAATIIQCLQEAMRSGSPTRLARERERQREHLEELERWAQRDIWDDFDGQ